MTETRRERLARLMDERRRDLRLTWTQVGKSGSITDETLRQIRNGTQEMRPLSKRAVEVGLQWEAGSVDQILAGGEPTPSRSTERSTEPMSAAGLLALAEAEVDKIWQLPGLSDADREELVLELRTKVMELLTTIDKVHRRGA